MLGRAPILDFDGTLARLVIPWPELRRDLGVERIDDLWDRPGSDAWASVRAAELTAALTAEPVAVVVAGCAAATAIAVLTSNSEDAVAEFLNRVPDLRAKASCIVGRETLGGPKTNFDRFSAGFARCVDATAAARGDEPVVYVGDMDYEIEFARRLGAVAMAVTELERA
jgi:phosphoglycolate phosphatase-like HAD superfamily hydrolase